MSRKYTDTIFLFSSVASTALCADTIIDCRVATNGVTSCDPYTHKMIYAREITYEKDRKKLIVEKTLPVPKKKMSMKIVSSEDMIKKYFRIDEPLRFKGAQKSPYLPVAHTVKTPSPTTKPHKISETPLTISGKPVTPKTSSTISEISITQKTSPQQSPPKNVYSIYRVKRGDSLTRIAHRYMIPIQALMRLNGLDHKSLLAIGQKLKLPLSKERHEASLSGEYRIKKGDTLLSIAKKFNLDPKEITKFNDIKSSSVIRVGKVIKLPFPYFVKQAKKAAKREAAKKRRAASKSNRAKMLKPFGTHKLRVTATAYTSHSGQTDKTPFLAAWNNRIKPGMKIIAVSRDLLTRYGLRNGSRVKIGGLRGYYTVRDKMNKRYRRRIDIYMGLDRRRALQWGRRSVTISW